MGNVAIDSFENIEYGVTNKTEEFVKLNPFGKIPTLKTADGQGIFESNAIARYVATIGDAKDQLLGATPLEQAKVNEWIDVVSYNIQPHVYPLFGFRFGYGTYDETKFKASSDAIATTLAVLENYLTTSFLTGEQVSLADIILGATLYGPMTMALDAEYRKPFPKVEAYLKRIYALPQFVAVVGEAKLLEKFEL